MHICYIDDSGDDPVRIYSALAVPADAWRSTLDAVKQHRREMKRTDGVFVTVELHARDFVAGRGRIAPDIVPKGARCRLFLETLRFIAALPGVRLFNACASSKANEALVFERMMNRINKTMESWDSRALLISDEGKDFTSLVRRMGVYNPIPSRYGTWPDGSPTKNIPLDRIVEDLIFRDSAKSQFIQLADFCAYALLRSEKPLASRSRYGVNRAFDLLRDICVKECYSADRRKLGIIRDC
jgi:Protein of unknown function (DUF3800)